MAPTAREITDLLNIHRWVLPFMATLFFALAGAAVAHQLQPGIADVSVAEGKARIELEISADTLLAVATLPGGIDPHAGNDFAARYAAIRALSREELAAKLARDWPALAAGLRLKAAGKHLSLRLDAVSVNPPATETADRTALLHLSASLPPGEKHVTFGWQQGFGPLVVRERRNGGVGYIGYLDTGEDSEPLPRAGAGAARPWLAAFADYVAIGFVHIVPKGADHILFVLGLFFFSLQVRPLLYQVSSFTLAHTFALAMSALGIVRVPSSIVEPLIAASIVFVAVENIRTTRYRASRTAVVFGFGLLHGLGFAAVLTGIGLSAGRFVTGLVGFNLGVEFGQLAVLAGAYALVGFWFGRKRWYRPVISTPASVAIAIVGAWWFVERAVL